MKTAVVIVDGILVLAGMAGIYYSTSTFTGSFLSALFAFSCWAWTTIAAMMYWFYSREHSK